MNFNFEDYLNISSVGLSFGFVICTVAVIVASIMGLILSFIKRI